jgi:hypothetical protein
MRARSLKNAWSCNWCLVFIFQVFRDFAILLNNFFCLYRDGFLNFKSSAFAFGVSARNLWLACALKSFWAMTEFQARATKNNGKKGRPLKVFIHRSKLQAASKSGRIRFLVKTYVSRYLLLGRPVLVVVEFPQLSLP